MLYNELLQQGLISLAQSVNTYLEQAKKRNYDKMSVHEKMEALRGELKGQKFSGYLYITDLYEDHLIASQEIREHEQYVSKLWKIPYVINKNVASFGSPSEVERIITYEPVGDGEANQSQEEPPKEIVIYQELNQAAPEPLLLCQESNLCLDQAELEQAKKTRDFSQGLSFKNAVLTTFEVENSAGHWYPKSVWQENLANLQTLAQSNQLLGESDHPLNGKPSIDRISLKIDQVWIEGNQILGNGKILPTEKGKNLIAQAVEGCPIPISSRGVGTLRLEQVKEAGGKSLMVVQSGFKCVTFDAVHAPSAPGSYIHGIEQGRTEEPKEITQSQNDGDTTLMNHWQMQLAILQGQIQLLKNMGKDVAAIEQAVTAQIETLTQANVNLVGLSEDQVKSLLAPFATMLNPTGPFPADPNKGQGIYDPGRMAQSQQVAGLPLQQAQQQVQIQAQEPAKGQELTQEQTASRDTLVTRLLQGYSAEDKTIFEGLLQSAKTAEEVMAKWDLVQGQVHKVLGFSTHSNSSLIIPSGIGMLEYERKIAAAPKNIDQAINKLSDGLPDLINQSTGERDLTPNNLKYQFELLLQNCARVAPHLMNSYIRLEQGQLEQAGEAFASDMAVSHATLLPIIRRVWPKLFLPVIASIQTMDRPTGEIRYLEAENQDGANLADQNYYYDYSDNNTEYAAAKKIKLTLTTETITALTKKLKAVLSYESQHKARAYYNMDLMQSAMEYVALQIAREWNNQGLYDLMMASGTSGNTDFGMNAPTEYDQEYWESQGLKTYLNKVSGDIYTNRQGEMSHILIGPTASVQLEKLGSKFGFLPAQGDSANEIYTGVNMFGTINGQYTVYKVQLFDRPWAINKALCLRKGNEFSDTPYVFAPFVTDIEPPKHGVDGDFSVSQGIMSTAAKKVVCPKAIATLTFKNQTGVRL